jgi:RNA polymerase sigma factor (sigma-70 family)
MAALSDEQALVAESCVDYARLLAGRECNRSGRADDYDETVSEAFWVMVRAAGCFDPAKGFSFTTYAHYAITRELSRRRGKQKVLRQRERAFAPGEDFPRPERAAPREGAEDILSLIDPEDATALRLRVLEGMTFRQIAARTGGTIAEARRHVAWALWSLRRLAA